MDRPKIDKEFQSICPAQTPEERSRLENSLATEGQLHPIWTWRGLVLDGHTRLEILDSLGIEPKFAEHPGGIDSREDAIEWIVNHQLGRRNLTEEQKRWLRGNRGHSEKKRVGAPIGSKNAAKNNGTTEGSLISDKPDNRVRTRLAKEYGVGTQTIDRDMKFVEHVREIDKKVPGAKEKILGGELKLERAQVQLLAEQPAKEIRKVLATPAKAKEEIARIKRSRPENQSEAEFWASQIDAYCRRIQAMIGMVPVAPWMPEAKLNRVKDSLRSAARMLESMKEPEHGT